MSSLKTLLCYSLYLLLYLFHPINSQLDLTYYNQYIEETGPNSEDIWRSTSDFIPVPSQSFGTIKLGEIMSMEFDFTFWGRTNSPRTDKYEMFFRVGFTAKNGSNCDGEGARYPSFWLSAAQNTMHVSVSSGGACQPHQSLDPYGLITIGETYHVSINLNNTHLYVSVSGGNKPDWNIVWDRQSTLKKYIGKDVNVWWMSDKYSGTDFNIGNGTFRNVIITSQSFTVSPTNQPTQSPTFVPTNIPTINPTNVPSDITGYPTLITGYPTLETGAPSKPQRGVNEFSTTVLVFESAELDTDVSGAKHILDTTLISIIIAGLAVLCCIICGIVILCWNRKTKTRKESHETENGYTQKTQHVRVQTNETEMRAFPNDAFVIEQNPKEIGVVYTRGEEDLYNNGDGTPVFTPDGITHEQFFSPAQKKELKSTPKGPPKNAVSNEELYGKYLSSAQKEKQNVTKGNDSSESNEAQALVSDDNCKTSDDDVIENMQTNGYIGAVLRDMNGEKKEDSSDSLSEMSDAPIEKKLTMTGEEDLSGNEFGNEHEYDESLSEYESNQDVTIQ